MPMATSLPITWAQTMVSASHWVGLTLPGMIELPGSFSGMRSSPSPQRGPEASQRTSLAILVSATARVRSAPWASTRASWAASASNLLGAETKGRPVRSAMTRAARRRSRAGRSARCRPRCRRARARRRRAAPPRRARGLVDLARPARDLLAERERRRVLQVGPADLDDVGELRAFARAAYPASRRSAGSSAPFERSTAAMCIAVGKASFEDWPRLTSSLGCTGAGSPRRRRAARWRGWRSPR